MVKGEPNLQKKGTNRRKGLSALHRKLLRELWGNRGPLFAIGLVIASGISTWVTNRSVLSSLQGARARYYETYNFSEIFSSLVRAPDRLARRLAAVPGVESVETRIVATVILDVPGVTELVTARLISLPDTGAPEQNQIFLEAGRLPEPGRENEVVVSGVFAAANALEVGSTFSALIHGRYRTLRIVGVGMSPEFVYVVKPGSLVPDNRLYGLVWLRRPALAHAFDLGGAFNDVVATLERGATPRSVITAFDSILEPYGGLGAYTRTDQFSNWYLESEFQQLEKMGTFIPMIFLGVAAFLLNVFLTRLLAQQREAIAVLKAFGYRNRQIAVHFLELVALIVVMATFFGTLGGRAAASAMVSLYSQFYVFPDLHLEVAPEHIRNAALIAGLAAIAGTFRAIQRAIRVPPAEAMRPPTPTQFTFAFWERLGIGRRLPVAARMVLRSVARQPMKSALSVIGIACGTSLLVTGNSMMDSMDFGMDTEYQRVHREDATVQLIQPRSRTRAAVEIEHLPGVLTVEPFRNVAVRLRHEHRERRINLEGVPHGRTLGQLLDTSLRPVEIPKEGLLISEKLAQVLGVEIGDRLRVEVLEGDRAVREIVVAETIATYFGMGAYLELDAMNRLLGEGAALTGALVALDPARDEDLNALLKETPAIAGISRRSDSIRSFEETAKKSFSVMSIFTYTFSLVIALGVVYNNARIILSERSRELASLRVLGYRRREISAILLGEIGLLTGLGIPLGLGLGAALSWILITSFDSELYRLPVVIDASTFGGAVLTIVVATTLVGLWVRRHLDKLDLVSVLKTRE